MNIKDIILFPAYMMIGIIVLNSKPVQDAIKNDITKRYKKNGYISYADWWLHPMHCMKLKACR